VTALHTTSKHLNQYLLNFWAKHFFLMEFNTDWIKPLENLLWLIMSVSDIAFQVHIVLDCLAYHNYLKMLPFTSKIFCWVLSTLEAQEPKFCTRRGCSNLTQQPNFSIKICKAAKTP